VQGRRDNGIVTIMLAPDTQGGRRGTAPMVSVQ